MALEDFKFYKIRLDRADMTIATPLTAKEGAVNGNGIELQIINGSVIEDMSGIAVYLNWKHQTTGAQGSEPFTLVDLNNGVYQVHYPTEMLVGGVVRADIKVVDAESVTVSTAELLIRVNTAATDTSVQSANVWNDIQTILVSQQQIRDRLTEIEEGGVVGPPGADGADGKSAYEIAVQNGFVGTEAQWLDSLNGADGTNGTDGADGKSAYQSALDGGFVGTELQFNESLADVWDMYSKSEVDGLVTPLAPKANPTFTGTVTASQISIDGNKVVPIYANAGAHNSIYRGKYLGNVVTAAQYLAISTGTFDDLFIGDYWTIGGINYRIAGFNYFYNVGDTVLQVNHAVIVPDTQLYAAVMNSTNITTGAYANSLMRTTNLASAIATIDSAFPGHVITHRQLLTNATNVGKASGWAWYDAKVEIMNEVMVYGSSAWGVSDLGNGFNIGSSNGQLPLFALRHDMMHNRQNWWLRDVVSAAYFAVVGNGGAASGSVASDSFGVRPAFSIS